MACESPGSGFGTGPFGSVPFGSTMPEGFRLVSAEVISANELFVTFDGDLQIANPCAEGDPTNIFAWELSVIDPPGKKASFVQHITFDGEQGLHIFFDRPFCCDFRYELTLTNQPEGIGCTSVTFIGPCVAKSALQTDNRDDDGFLRDIANPFLEKDATQKGHLLALGTFEITSDGDIAQDHGVASLRKRILRRATTLAGEFFHLGEYGAGLETKRLARPDLLMRYQEKLRAQIEREPEVRAASVRISQVVGNPDVVAVYIRAQTMSGDPVDLSVPITLP